MKKRVNFNNSVFMVEKLGFKSNCGVIEGTIIPCPFYRVNLRDFIVRYRKVKNNTATLHTKNLERHACLLIKTIGIGTDSGDKLWKLCPGEAIK